VIDIANADRPVVELAVNASVKPSDIDRELLDRIGALAAEDSRHPATRDR
jgi:hypothetical protein